MQDETVNRTGSLGKFDTCSRSQPGDTGFSFTLSCTEQIAAAAWATSASAGLAALSCRDSVTSALNQRQTAAPAPRGDPGAPKRLSPPAGRAAPPEVVPGRGLRVRPRVALGRREDRRLYGARRPALLGAEGLGKPRVGERGSGRCPGRSLSALDLAIARPQHREQSLLPQDERLQVCYRIVWSHSKASSTLNLLPKRAREHDFNLAETCSLIRESLRKPPLRLDSKPQRKENGHMKIQKCADATQALSGRPVAGQPRAVTTPVV
ncbi:hypothetical protein E2I00_007204 [Balaenoptera physalus]|uniref:Uncharacterized protein n=1 Tax=Balaenoptera physalus TaxID=9770 RepID=A0A643C7Z6_BALPH|nr:hypothetical protein E2I00_007204 [Balaenoptera physalus]